MTTFGNPTGEALSSLRIRCLRRWSHPLDSHHVHHNPPNLLRFGYRKFARLRGEHERFYGRWVLGFVLVRAKVAALAKTAVNFPPMQEPATSLMLEKQDREKTQAT